MNIYEKILEVQRKCPQLIKESTAAGGKFSWDYFNMESFKQRVEPVLHELKLLHYSKCEGNTIRVLIHDIEADEEISSYITLPTREILFDMGKDLTYLKRYLLLNLLGLIPMKDEETEAVGTKPFSRSHKQQQRDDFF